VKPGEEELFGARHKVARARKHLVNLNAETAAFLKPGETTSGHTVWRSRES
jgi:hypothetical protein